LAHVPGPGFIYYMCGIMLKACFISCFTLITVLCFAQNIDLSEEITDIAEHLAASETGNESAGLYIEQLHDLAEVPVRINSADESEISRFFFLSDFQVKNIIDYIKTSGSIVSSGEIAYIPGIDRHTAEMMIPFTDLSVSPAGNSDSLRLRSNYLTNFIFRPGESDTSFIGGSFKLLTKYRITLGRFSGGFAIEKDDGEKLFDFLSGYLDYTGQGIIRKVIAGDYSCRFGQGLCINTGIRTGLPLTIADYSTARNVIKPYTSTNENNFFRGLAAQFAWKITGLTIFFSSNNIDAAVSLPADSSMTTVEGFYESGLHNTESLLHKKDVMREISYGVSPTLSFRNLKIGFCWTESRFSLPVSPDKNDPENLYDFEGNLNSVLSAYYNLVIGRMLLCGEAALNGHENYAIAQGITIRPSDRLSMNFLYRKYTPGYFSFHGYGPGINSAGNNETGLLGSFTLEAAKHLFVSAGADIVKFPWLKYRTGYPSMAKRIEVKFSYLPDENLSLDLTFNIRYSMLDREPVQGIPGVEEIKNSWVKAQVKYQLNERLSLATRIDFRKIEPSESTGVSFLQDVTFSFTKIPLKFWFRYCTYNTDDWDSRIYAYENDLPGSFSIPALSGTGTRSYLMARWQLGKRAELRLKYGITSVFHYGISEETDELRLQFRIWF